MGIWTQDWATARPAIMKHNNWLKANSEVLIRYGAPDDTLNPLPNTKRFRSRLVHSTPRRFGKTFSIAIFCAYVFSSLDFVSTFSPRRRLCAQVSGPLVRNGDRGLCKLPLQSTLHTPHADTRCCAHSLRLVAQAASSSSAWSRCAIPDSQSASTVLTPVCVCSRSSSACSTGEKPHEHIRLSVY